MEAEVVSFPQLNTDQKLSVREAQYQVIRLQQLSQQAAGALQQLVEKLAKEVGANPETMLFSVDTLQFVPKQ